MPSSPRARSLTARLTLLDEVEKSSSPSYFEWQEQTARIKAFQPALKPEPKRNSLVRLFRRFA